MRRPGMTCWPRLEVRTPAVLRGALAASVCTGCLPQSRPAPHGATPLIPLPQCWSSCSRAFRGPPLRVCTARKPSLQSHTQRSPAATACPTTPFPSTHTSNSIMRANTSTQHLPPSRFSAHCCFHTHNDPSHHLLTHERPRLTRHCYTPSRTIPHTKNKRTSPTHVGQSRPRGRLQAPTVHA